MKIRPSLWNLRPLGQPSYCVTSSQSPLGVMGKMRPKGMSTNHRLPSRSKEGPSRKHSTSAPWRFGSDQSDRDFLRYFAGIDMNTSALIISNGWKGLYIQYPCRYERWPQESGQSAKCNLGP